MKSAAEGIETEEEAKIQSSVGHERSGPRLRLTCAAPAVVRLVVRVLPCGSGTKPCSLQHFGSAPGLSL